MPESFRQAIQRGVQTGIYQDVAVGWIDGKARGTWFLGQAQEDNSFEIGAATEVFTGLLLAEGAYRGKLRLQSSIRELLPADFPFADPALGAVTLEALATHRAGLPAVPPNLMPGKIDDPYADYSEQDLRDFLANYRMSAPSSNHTYSMLDAGLLGYLLGCAYATNYAKLLNEKILLPLGLKHTGFEDGSRLLAGHSRGQTTAHWHFSALLSSAGLRSTMNDLLDLLQRNLLPEESPLRAALLLARQPRAQIPLEVGPGEEIGLGWNIVQVSMDEVSGQQKWPLAWRASSTLGFSTFIGFRTDRQQAMVLLGNTDAGFSGLGLAWLKGDAPPSLPPAHASQPTVEQLGAYPGLYQVRGGIEITIRQHGNELTAQLSGQPAAQLHADGEDVFDAGADGFGISFQREAGKVTNLLLNYARANFLARRLSERAPRLPHASIMLDAKALLDYAGDYRLDANTLARIALRGDTLNLQLTGRTALPLHAFAQDRFAVEDDSCELVFERDAPGKISAVRIALAGTERDALRIHWIRP